MKRQMLVMAGVVLLAGCGADAQENPEEHSSTTIEGTDSDSELIEDAELNDNASDLSEEIDTEDTAAESEEELSENQNMPLNVTAFDSLIDEETFTNEGGYQAWMDYKEITSAYTLGDLTGSTEDAGSTLEEMDQLIEEVLDRDDVIRDVIEITETDKMIFYRYPLSEESTDRSAELSFYYIEDELMFSSITPSFYSVDITSASTYEELTTLITLDEILEREPEVFTVAQVNLYGDVFNQLMVASQSPAGEEEGSVSAFYFITMGEAIVQYATVPFLETAQDFATYSVMVFSDFVSTLNSMQ